jgi:hypothetical protein
MVTLIYFAVFRGRVSLGFTPMTEAFAKTDG